MDKPYGYVIDENNIITILLLSTTQAEEPNAPRYIIMATTTSLVAAIEIVSALNAFAEKGA